MFIPDSSIAFRSDITPRPRNGRPVDCSGRLSIGVGPDISRLFASAGQNNGRRLFIDAA